MAQRTEVDKVPEKPREDPRQNGWLDRFLMLAILACVLAYQAGMFARLHQWGYAAIGAFGVVLGVFAAHTAAVRTWGHLPWAQGKPKPEETDDGDE